MMAASDSKPYRNDSELFRTYRVAGPRKYSLRAPMRNTSNWFKAAGMMEKAYASRDWVAIEKYLAAGDTMMFYTRPPEGMRSFPREYLPLANVACMDCNYKLLGMIHRYGHPVSPASPDNDMGYWLPNLHYAIKFESRKMFDWLLGHGASIGAVNTANKNTVIHTACFYDRLDWIDYLVARGANINAVNATGNTALMMAVGMMNKALLTTLLSHGADPNIANNGVTHPLHLCDANNLLDYAQLLIQAGARVPDDITNPLKKEMRELFEIARENQRLRDAAEGISVIKRRSRATL